MKEKINIAVEHSKKIQEELQVSDTTVRLALRYVWDSDIAKAVRALAKKLLLEEASKIEDETNLESKE